MTRLRVVLALAALPMVPGSLHAQGRGSHYADYTSPTSCLGTLMRVTIGTNWNTQDDTLGFNPDDILPQVARDSAADCMRRFYPTPPDVAKVPYHQVAGLFFWGRASGDDSLAARAFRRGLGAQKQRIDSADVYWHGSYAYSARPFRLPVAQEMAKRLDDLGVVGERPMMPYNDHWESQHDGPGNLAQTLFDTTAMKVETAGERRNYLALPDTARHGAELVGITSEAKSTLLALVRNPRADSAVAALKARAIEVLGPDQKDGRWGEGLLLLGDRWPTMHPEFWFNRPAGDTVSPRPGRVTLVQEIPIQTCSCGSFYSSIHRLKQQFGDSLDIIVLARTAGHWARRVQLAPAEEAELLRHAVLDSLKLPVTLGVYTTTFVANPAPDNRLVPQLIPELKKVSFSGSAVIIDRRGIVQLAGLLSFGAWNERALTALLGSLLRAPAD